MSIVIQASSARRFMGLVALDLARWHGSRAHRMRIIAGVQRANRRLAATGRIDAV
ncbi:hypothetical protein [Aurantimonas sp. VKM B-3413]|uniref:hypothetical protein n=1 Tax=Aurantimonas sp. VKM B-3413 TaxID=2779401 RepID=UPI001E560B7F|nr:hypothetical protein [Aurantimonas sp. VKM B-3413]MCB8836762.1 hypothetical protein [Aurantimonas sp. VKM B-3413]